MSGLLLCSTVVRFSFTPFVAGELVPGNLRQRDAFLGELLRLPRAIMAFDDEVLRLIDREMLLGRGICYIDAHLLAATRLTAHTKLWTRDRTLNAVAVRLELAATLMH